MVIEKNIPIPASENKKGHSKYPFSKMSIGDSVFFPGEKAADQHSPPYLSAKKHGRENNKRFSGRKVEGGIRIWRIA